jgi:hypothetical protein
VTDTAARNINDLELELSVGGDVETVRFGSFTGVDARLFRQEMGMSLRRAWFAVLLRNEDWDTDLVAGIVWLHQRKSNPQLLWDQVAERVTYDDMVRPSVNGAGPSMNGDSADGGVGDPDPEA